MFSQAFPLTWKINETMTDNGRNTSNYWRIDPNIDIATLTKEKWMMRDEKLWSLNFLKMHKTHTHTHTVFLHLVNNVRNNKRIEVDRN
jgi:hypothetical protein